MFNLDFILEFLTKRNSVTPVQSEITVIAPGEKLLICALFGYRTYKIRLTDLHLSATIITKDDLVIGERVCAQWRYMRNLSNYLIGRTI